MAHPASWPWLPSRVCTAVATTIVGWRCGQWWWWRRRACPGDRAGVPERDRRHLAQRLKRARLGRPQSARPTTIRVLLHPWTGAPRTRDGNLAPLSEPLIAAVLKSAKQIHKQPSYSCAHRGTYNQRRYVGNTPRREELLPMPPSALWVSYSYRRLPRPGESNFALLAVVKYSKLGTHRPAWGRGESDRRREARWR